MRIYVSHSASVASAPKLGHDPEQAALKQEYGSAWFVVQPINDPGPQVDSLRRAGRTVVALDVEPNQGLVHAMAGYRRTGGGS